MVTKNGIDYNDVWKMDGKFFTLAESCIADWDTVFQGTELWNQNGKGYVEVEYCDPAPHWTNEKVRTITEIRSCIREMLKVPEYIAIRIIAWDKDKNGVSLIKYIGQFDDLGYIRKRYPYGTYIDKYAKQWCDSIISLEGVKDEIR